MISYPNAKINLGLHVINKRNDGFHNIETVFYPIGFSDILECVENKSYAKHHKCTIVQSGIPVSGNIDTNLVVRAYHLMDEQFELPPVLVHLHKVLPMGAGLGGGSSDAAFMLKMLNQLFHLNLNNEELAEKASVLGSDCAFFINNKPAYLLGKGHELQPIGLSLHGYYLVLVNTGAHSNTAMAYANVQRRDTLKPEESLKVLLKQPVNDWRQSVKNDFELSVFAQLPELGYVKNWLYEQGALYAAMSGSGASMFGIFADKPELNGGWTKDVVYQGRLA